MLCADVTRDGVHQIDTPSASVVPLIIGGLTSSVGLEVAGATHDLEARGGRADIERLLSRVLAGEMGSGEVVVVTGASGGTGLFAVQLVSTPSGPPYHPVRPMITPVGPTTP